VTSGAVESIAEETTVFELNDDVATTTVTILSDRSEIVAPSVQSNSNSEAPLKSANASGTVVPILRTAKRSSCYCGTPIKANIRPGPDDDPCWVNQIHKIIGGEPASIRDYPWTVGLLRRGFLGFGGSSKPFCGGTLINDRYVITASHCVDGQIPQNLQVLINEQDLTVSTESMTIKKDVERIIMHAGYDRRVIDNDIALIKLAEPIPLGGGDNTVRPVCLPANNDNDFDGLTATTAGWGVTSQGGSQSKVLLKVDVPIISNKVCNSDQTQYSGKITANMICAGHLNEGGKDACQGDSGGPLIIENGGRRTLVGVVSWGYGCAKPHAPGVYTRVARYPDWILSNTRDAEWCG